MNLRRLAALLPLLALPAGAAEDAPAGGLLTPPAPLLAPGPGLLTTPITDVLPADEAFPLDVLVELPGTLVLMWEIQEGYYLYRKSLEFDETGEPSVLDAPHIPLGVQITDEFFGDVEVYYDRLLVRIPFESGKARELELAIQYQGCAEIGYCYPEQHKTVRIELPR